VPIAIALGYDKPATDLMERKPRPLSQPVINRNQWMRLVFIGLLIAIATLVIETIYDGVVAATMGFVAFGLLNVVLGLANRSETETVFSRENLSDRHQLILYGIALLMIFLPTEMRFGERIGLTSLTGDQWFVCIATAVGILLITEVVKFFLRRSRKEK
jgi:Ca2+-transporting ATPase